MHRTLTDTDNFDAVSFSPDSFTYNGTAQAPVITGTALGLKNFLGSDEDSVVTLTEGTDYTIGYQQRTSDTEPDGVTWGEVNAPVSVGDYRMVAVGKGNYDGSAPIGITFTINPKDITHDNNIEISVTPTNMVYDGEAKSITVAVKNGDSTLIENSDYTYEVSPSPIKAAGTYTITVTGTGNYKGTKTATFTIEALSAGSDEGEGSQLDSGFAVTLQSTYQYTGSQITPEPNVTRMLITALAMVKIRTLVRELSLSNSKETILEAIRQASI